MERLSDEKLLVRINRGDEAALGVLFGRYVGDLADFAVGVVRDRDVAVEVVARTFERVWDRLQAGVRVDFVKAWLYVTARDEALTAGHRRVLDADEPDLLATVDAWRSSAPQGMLEDKELVRLVRAAAERISPRDYSLLDLHLRRNLSAKELATALSLERAEVSILLSRLQAALEAPVTASLLAAYGRGSCEALASILTAAQDSPPSDIRAAIRGHLRGCATCQQCTRQFAAPAAIFAGLVTTPPSEQFVTTVWGSIAHHLANARGSAVGIDSRHRSPRRRVVLTGAAAATVAVASAVTALAAMRAEGPSANSSITRTATAVGVSPQAAFLPPLRPTPSVTRSRAVVPEDRPAPPVSPTPPAERKFGWVPVKGAVAYQLALFRDDAVVFTTRTREQRVTLPSEWLYDGRAYRLTNGTYHWYVWPIMNGANAPKREANVSAQLVIE